MVGEFVVPGGDGAVLFEPVEEPFDLVTLPVRRPVKVALRWFTPRPGNDRRNPALPQGIADRLAAVALVPGQPVGPQPGAACSGPLDCSVVEQGG